MRGNNIDQSCCGKVWRWHFHSSGFWSLLQVVEKNSLGQLCDFKAWNGQNCSGSQSQVLFKKWIS